MSKIVFKGIMPALITPIDKQGNVMVETVRQLIDRYLAAGVDGFYAVGSTGEGVLLTLEQRKAMAKAAIEANAGRGKVIVHTGAINCQEVLELTRYATAAGADGISSILPSIYFQYSFDQIIRFYQDIAANTHLPVLIYANNLGRGGDINHLLAELLKTANIIGAKDTRANYYALWQLKQLNGGDVNVINGPDESLLCGLTMGADGGIGSTYGLMPEKYVGIYRAFMQGDIQKARKIQYEANAVIQVLLAHSKGSSILPLKEALRLCGMDVGVNLYPTEDFTDEQRSEYAEALKTAGFDFWK